MSLSVLVDNVVRWEGTGPAKRRILEPPSPDTIKTITNLVAASTGLNAARGDQLIVESLPFESSLNAEPPAGPLPPPKPGAPEPAWLQFLRKNRDLVLPLCATLGLILLFARAMIRLMLRRKSVPAPETAPALPPGSGLPHSAQLDRAVAGESPMRIAADVNADQSLETAERVRQLAKDDLVAATNVVRFWLHETETRPI